MHDARSIVGHLISVLKLAYKDIFSVSDGDCDVLSKLPLREPKLHYQHGGWECGDIMLFYIREFIAGRDKPFTFKDLVENFKSRITLNPRFKYNVDGVDGFKSIRRAWLAEIYTLSEIQRNDMSVSEPVAQVPNQQMTAVEKPIVVSTDILHSKHPDSESVAQVPIQHMTVPEKPKMLTMDLMHSKLPGSEPVARVPNQPMTVPEKPNVISTDILHPKLPDSEPVPRIANQQMTVPEKPKVVPTTDLMHFKPRTTKTERRVSNFYRDQAGVIGKLEKAKLIEYWDGDEFKGQFMQACQITIYPARIIIYGKPKRGSYTFMDNAVIVYDSRVYFPIEIERIKVAVPVMQGLYPCTRLTGMISFYGGSTRSTLVRWGFEQPKFVPSDHITSITQSETRTKKSPDRLIADEKGQITCKNITTKVTALAASTKVPSSGNNRASSIKFYREKLTQNGELKCKDDVANFLFYHCYFTEGMRYLCGNKRSKSLDKNMKKNASALLTAIFECISGSRACRGTKSDIGLHHEAVTYPFPCPGRARKLRRLPTRSNVPSSISTQAATNISKTPSPTRPKTPSKARPVCKQRGCSTLAHWNYAGYCASHKKVKKLCTTCKTFLGKFSGGLCRSCFNRKYPTPESIRLARMCIQCLCRETRSIGIRCEVCRPRKVDAKKRQRES